MKKDTCFELGHITKTFGLEGYLTAFIDSDFPENYYEMESVLLEIKGELIPFFIEDYKETSNPQKVNFLFEEIDSFEKAKVLIGAKMYLPEEVLPDLGENKFYYHEIIGFKVLDTQNNTIGIIKEVYENIGNDFFALENDKLIPIVDDFIVKIDKINKQIIMNLPDGLLEL